MKLGEEDFRVFQVYNKFCWLIFIGIESFNIKIIFFNFIFCFNSKNYFYAIEKTK